LDFSVLMCCEEWTLAENERISESANGQDGASPLPEGWVLTTIGKVAKTIGVNLSVTSDDFQVGELFERGGWITAGRLFGTELPALVEELNQAWVM